jgi:hypothetical protein
MICASRVSAAFKEQKLQQSRNTIARHAKLDSASPGKIFPFKFNFSFLE